MAITQKTLIETFKKAKTTKSPYVFVIISADRVEEVIVIPEKSFDAKEAFYKGAYTDDLVHVMNKSVFIRGLSYGEATELSNFI